MNENFVPYELSIKLKEKGFNRPCCGYYHIGKGDDSFETCINSDFLNSLNEYRVGAPTIPHVLKWLREEKNILVCVLPTGWNHARECSLYYYVVYDTTNYFWKREEYQQSIETYEEAELAGIEYVLNNWI